MEPEIARFRNRLKGAAKVAAVRAAASRRATPSRRRLAFPRRCRFGDSWPIGAPGRTPTAFLRLIRAAFVLTGRFRQPHVVVGQMGRPQGRLVEPG
jgi:hypothetical protein